MFSNLKRRVAVLSAIAVMAALIPALSVSTASALPQSLLGATASSPGDAHSYVACPSGSAAAAGFTDTTSTDVDCIAMYGITKGVTATTYEPSANIPRWQMALYLTRMLKIGGYTLGSGADQGFTDIGGLSAEIQTGINQLKQSGVTTGTTATTFAPDDNVTREQMAMFVERLLGKVAAGPGGSADTASSINVNGGTTTYNYTDIDGGSVTFEGHNSIIELYNLGVIGDASTATTFNPSGLMTRGDMATWLTNALDHTNARPAGLTLQTTMAAGYGATSPVLVASHRTADFAPVSGTVIDVFQYQVSAVPELVQWGATNLCSAQNSAVGNSLTACVIDVGDNATNAAGNMGPITESAAASKTQIYTAWTGAIAEKFVNGTTANASVNVVNSIASTVLTMSVAGPGIYGDEKTNAGADDGNGNGDNYTPVKFGTDSVISLQLASSDVTGNIPTGIANTLIVCSHSIFPDNSAVATSTSTNYLYTDASGAASYTVTQADPKPYTATEANSLNHTVSCTSGALAAPYSATDPNEGPTAASALLGPTSNIVDTNGVIRLRYTDVAAVAHKTMITQNAKYGLIATNALVPVNRTATATVYDQYGKGVAGQTVYFGGAVAAVTDDGTADNLINIGGGVYAKDRGFRWIELTGDSGDCYSLGTQYYNLSAVSAKAQPALTIDGTVIACAQAKTTTGKIVTDTESDMTAMQVTDANGVASIGWQDNDTGSANTTPDVVVAATGTIVAAGADAGMGSATYYRAAKPANVASAAGLFNPAAPANLTDADDNNTALLTMLYDTTAQDIVLKATYDEDNDGTDDADFVTTMVYSYDDNDQFTCNTTPCTFATWQSALNGTSTTHLAWSSDKNSAGKGLTGAAYDGSLVSNVNTFTWTEQ